MDHKDINCTNLIIGGTIKAATSSVFTYLSAHPEVCGSSVKETFFFTQGYTGKADSDLKRYGKYFAPKTGHKILVEASPNYLGFIENIAPKIKTLLPDAKFIFSLRNPVDRLYSYYNFAMGKLELPKTLAFEKFIDQCEQYSAGTLTPEESGIALKHLRALEIGGYSKYLRNYYDLFPAENIKVVFFEHLKQDPVSFMSDISGFLGISPDFYQNYKFEKVNVTFSGNVKMLHYIAMLLNRMLESVLRQRPELKMRLVHIYKSLNQKREGYVGMPDLVRTRLIKYYSQSNKELGAMLAGQELPRWVNRVPDE